MGQQAEGQQAELGELGAQQREPGAQQGEPEVQLGELGAQLGEPGAQQAGGQQVEPEQRGDNRRNLSSRCRAGGPRGLGEQWWHCHRGSCSMVLWAFRRGNKDFVTLRDSKRGVL